MAWLQAVPAKGTINPDVNTDEDVDLRDDQRKSFTLMDRQICLQTKFEGLSGFALTMGGFTAFIITQYHGQTFTVIDESGRQSLDTLAATPDITRFAVGLMYWSFIFNITSGMVSVLFSQFLGNFEYQKQIMPIAQKCYSLSSTCQGIGGVLFLFSVALFSIGTQLHHWMKIVTLVLAGISLVGVNLLFVFMGVKVMPYDTDGKHGLGRRPLVSSD